MIGNQDPSCKYANPDEFEGDTVYVCNNPGCPVFQQLCDMNICCPEDDEDENNHDCIFKDYYGLCSNDNSYNHGDYCSGRCGDFASK